MCGSLKFIAAPLQAQTFKFKSIAEQNSVEIAWNLFSRREFTNLRNLICPDKQEFLRLRQLVVNIVMATGKEQMNEPVL